MKIGLLGTGYMGKTLARKLAAAEHEVKVANSRSPACIMADVLETGASATTAEEALTDVDIVILSMPATGFEKVRSSVAKIPIDTVVIDTSNYAAMRDGRNPEIDAGKVESEWVQDYFGRPIVKAWNSIGSDSFARKAQPLGHPERIAIPVAGDVPRHREVAMALVDDTGFDAFDAGVIAESWRQQPGSPVYCTDLAYDEIGPALASAERHRLARRSEIALAVITERMGLGIPPDAEWGTKIFRALFS